MRAIIMLTAVVTLTTGCWSNGGKKSGEVTKVSPELAQTTAKVANAFRKGDAAGQKALEQADMDMAKFEHALYEIAMNPKASEAYAKALVKK